MRTSHFLYLIASMLLLANGLSEAAVQTADWNGGTGNWSNISNWDIGAVPNNGVYQYTVLIDNGDAANSIVSLDQNTTISILNIQASDTLNLLTSNEMRVLSYINNSGTGNQADGSTLNIAGYLDNSNNWNLNSSGNISSQVNFLYSGSVEFRGTSQLNLSDALYNNILGNTSSGTDNILTNTINHTIRGAGDLGTFNDEINNAGLILADKTTNPLDVTFGWVNSGCNNSGAIRSTDTGGMILRGTLYGSGGGKIEAVAGSKITP